MNTTEKKTKYYTPKPNEIILLKHCCGKSACDLIKPLDDFYSNKNTKDGKDYYCKQCYSEKARKDYLSDSSNRKESSRRWNIENKERRREISRKSRLAKAYNIGPEEPDILSEKQGGVCAICRKPETKPHNITGKEKRLCVDHNHETGEIRGMLCERHNLGLGNFEDNPDYLVSALFHLGLSAEEIMEKVKEEAERRGITNDTR